MHAEADSRLHDAGVQVAESEARLSTALAEKDDADLRCSIISKKLLKLEKFFGVPKARRGAGGSNKPAKPSRRVFMWPSPCRSRVA